MINEHLIEALRRLRKNSSESNVDRRLVTNVLLSFITTPRADPKRFEMLQLLSSILSWTDAEREKAGLQRMGTAGAPQQNSGGSAFWSRSISGSGSQPAELDKADETEVNHLHGLSVTIAHSLLAVILSALGGVPPHRSNLWLGRTLVAFSVALQRVVALKPRNEGWAWTETPLLLWCIEYIQHTQSCSAISYEQGQSATTKLISGT